jgi:hypothetical protein
MSAQLRGILPEEIQHRFKAFIYGKSGVGKTTFALQFPAPYYIDCEGGSTQSAYAKILKESGGMYFACNDFHDLYQEVLTLAKIKHGFKTLIIDPISYIHANLVEECMGKTLTSAGNEDSRRGYALANRYMKKLIALLLKLDMNVILTAHSKDMLDTDMKYVGQTWDGYKKLDYAFDLMIEAGKTENDKRYGIIKKTRGDMFKGVKDFDFSYEEVKRLSGCEALEHDAKPLDLISEDTMHELKFNLDMAGISQAYIDSILQAKKLTDLSELSNVQAKKWIESLVAKAAKKIQEDFENVVTN